MKEFQKYSVGELSTNEKWVNSDCIEFKKVYHVAHLETSFRILKDRKIKAGLVFDKSKLNSERILVTWLSPNTWSDGSRYGNIQFELDFDNIIQGKNYYWVEVITDYRPHACRILVTKNNYSSQLEEYNPAIGDGPWFYDEEKKTHYRNGDYCLEFMFEENLPIDRIKKIDFVSHHEKFCNIDHRSCKDKGLSHPESKKYFFSKIISDNILIDNAHFTVTDEKGEINLNDDLRNFLNEILWQLSRGLEFIGSIKANNELASALIKSILHFISLRDLQSAKKMASLFIDKSEFQNSLISVICQRFDVQP